jgi:hypothetical protein
MDMSLSDPKLNWKEHMRVKEVHTVAFEEDVRCAGIYKIGWTVGSYVNNLSYVHNNQALLQ